MDDFPEEVCKLEKQGQNYHKEGRVLLFVGFLFLDTFIDSEEEKTCENKQQGQE
jgi:hypothetical protein